jgi:hypothetical protein
MTSDVSPQAPSISQAASPVKQLTVFLHNRVGALLALVKLLHDNKVEVLGFSVQDAVEMTLVRLVVTDPDNAEQVLLQHGHSCATRTIVVVELKQGAHDLGHALGALLGAEINIHHSYPLMTRPGGFPLLALYLDDAEIGGESLSRCGYKVLSQGDLSR